MATRIKTLTEGTSGDIVLPRTVAKAVTLEDGTSLDVALENRDTDDVMITEELANSLGLPQFTRLSKVLESMNNTISTAQATMNVYDATVE